MITRSVNSFYAPKQNTVQFGEMTMEEWAKKYKNDLVKLAAAIPMGVMGVKGEQADKFAKKVKDATN